MKKLVFLLATVELFKKEIPVLSQGYPEGELFEVLKSEDCEMLDGTLYQDTHPEMSFEEGTDNVQVPFYISELGSDYQTLSNFGEVLSERRTGGHWYQGEGMAESESDEEPV